MTRKSILLFFLFLFFIQSVFALGAESNDYSIGKFRDGSQAGNWSSDSYLAISASMFAPGTRNAVSESLTSNIGFFDGTLPSSGVQIKSYVITPNSVANGSLVQIYIEALNADNVWAVINLPDGTNRNLVLTNNGAVSYLPPLIGTYNVYLYANNSLGYISSAVSSFQVTASSPSSEGGTSGGGGGGGGSGGNLQSDCTYSLECSAWGECIDGKQTRTCENKGTCKMNKLIETIKCSNALFDILFNMTNSSLREDEYLKINLKLVKTQSTEKIDVFVHYNIYNEDGAELFNQVETRAVENTLIFEKKFDQLSLKNGKYRIRVTLIYGNDQTAFAEQQFVVDSSASSSITGAITGEIGKNSGIIKIALQILGILLGILLVIWVFRLAIRKFRHFDFSLSLPKINFIGKSGKLDSGREYLTDMIGKQVYSSSGEKLGKIIDVYIEGISIHSVMVKLDSKISNKKISLLFKDVSSISEIIIVKGSKEHIINKIKATG